MCCRIVNCIIPNKIAKVGVGPGKEGRARWLRRGGGGPGTEGWGSGREVMESSIHKASLPKANCKSALRILPDS